MKTIFMRAKPLNINIILLLFKAVLRSLFLLNFAFCLKVVGGVARRLPRLKFEMCEFSSEPDLH